MDFSAIFQMRTKKFWWMDVIFYFVMSMLIATLLCYAIFSIKYNSNKEEIRKQDIALQTVGTDQQKEEEKQVINYQKKILDFSDLLENHEFASHVFAFMQKQTMPNAWFKQFLLDKKNNTVKLSGESDSMDAFSRQVTIFENNEYVKNIGNLNSSLGQESRIQFNADLVLNQKIFDYAKTPTVADANASAEQLLAQQNQLNPSSQTGTQNNLSPQAIIDANSSDSNQQNPQAPVIPSSEKSIISFNFLLNPAVAGTINSDNIISVNVPHNIDVGNLISSIVISPNATISPESGVPESFTSPVIYRVTAQDGSFKDYKVTVKVLPEIVKNNNNSGIIILLISLLVVIIICVVVFILIRKRNKKA